MKRLANISLLLSSLIGYLEWGKDHRAFLFEVERDLFVGKSSTESFFHPIVLLPLCGQLILLFTVFQRSPGRVLTIIGLGCLSTIMLLVLLAGLLSLNLRIISSVIPYIISGIFVLRYSRKRSAIS